MTDEMQPTRSADIGALAEALAKAQGAFEPVLKSRSNPLFHSQYATLDDIISATRKGLSANGLAVMQTIDGKNLVTTIVHMSGQWQSSAIEIMVGNIQSREGKAVLTTAQAYGSALTYARRYGLAPLLCVAADEDDDGNNAGQQQGKPKAETRQDARTAPKPANTASTSYYGPVEPAPKGMCSHGVAYKERQGTKQDGTAYKFWSASHKLDDGKWCQDRPAKPQEPKAADVDRAAEQMEALWPESDPPAPTPAPEPTINPDVVRPAPSGRADKTGRQTR